MRPLRVLVAPLDWGLGHATRCIPVVRELLKQGAQVRLAASGSSMLVLKEAFPALEMIELPAYGVTYSEFLSARWSVLSQLPRLLRVIKQEHRQVNDLVNRVGFDVIISDNRYGCWSTNCKNIFLGHQLNLGLYVRFSFLKNLVNRWHDKFLQNFHQVWVPDYPDRRLTWDLSILKFGPPIFFVGSLSRFARKSSTKPQRNVLVILSGPEPQRAVLENLLVGQLKKSSLSYLIVRGLPGTSDISDPVLINHLSAQQLEQAILESNVVISRSGYSTIMDLLAMGKKAIFIPTPGQPEQEYLASRLAAKKLAVAAPQQGFELMTCWQQLSACADLGSLYEETNYLKLAVSRLHEEVHR